MFSKDQNNTDNETYDALQKNRGSANVVIGNGVKIIGQILEAETIQIDGTADVTMSTQNLLIGLNGDVKGELNSHNVEVLGKLDGNIKVTGTLTVQEDGIVSGKVEYENLQVKLGGQISGDIQAMKKSSAKQTITSEDDNINDDENDNDSDPS